MSDLAKLIAEMRQSHSEDVRWWASDLEAALQEMTNNGHASDKTDKHESPINRILWNERGRCIDEIVMHDAHVHIEQMDDRCWWVGIYLDGGVDRYWMGNFVCDSRGHMRFVEQENYRVEWDDDRSHEIETAGQDVS